MTIDDERIEYAARHTEILRLPKQTLSTFGTTSIYYYLVTEPAYLEPEKESNETVIREGKVISQKPRIVTPYYLSRLEGFSTDARRYFDKLTRTHGSHSPGLFYTYRNEPKELHIVSNNWQAVVDKLNAEIDKRGDPLAAIIKGKDELWDVSLLKFIFEITRNSLPDNIAQLKAHGLLGIDSRGMPVEARIRIEELFQQVLAGEREPHELESELNRWDVFDEYQDRFFALFKRRR